MAKVFFPYGTTEGQTAKIAEYIAEVIRDHGHEAVPVDIKRSTGPGSRRLQRRDRRGLHPHGQTRQACRGIRGEEPRRARAATVRVLLGQPRRPWRHRGSRGLRRAVRGGDGVASGEGRSLGGALLYTHYGFVKRHMMKRIARDKPGNLGTDTSRDYVYTEWDGVPVRRGLLDLPRWQSGHHQQLAHRRREVPPIGPKNGDGWRTGSCQGPTRRW